MIGKVLLFVIKLWPLKYTQLHNPHAQLVGSQSGDVIVPMYDWSSYFDEKTIKTSLNNITQMHHFRFTKLKPGKVMVRNNSTDSTDLEREITLIKDVFWRLNDFSQPISPPGLSLERQWYLRDRICDFCPEDCRDLVYPEPLTPLH